MVRVIFNAAIISLAVIVSAGINLAYAVPVIPNPASYDHANFTCSSCTSYNLYNHLNNGTVGFQMNFNPKPELIGSVVDGGIVLPNVHYSLEVSFDQSSRLFVGSDWVAIAAGGSYSIFADDQDNNVQIDNANVGHSEIFLRYSNVTFNGNNPLDFVVNNGGQVVGFVTADNLHGGEVWSLAALNANGISIGFADWGNYGTPTFGEGTEYLGAWVTPANHANNRLFNIQGDIHAEVPEPASMFLLGSGLSSLGLIRRRRKNNELAAA